MMAITFQCDQKVVFCLPRLHTMEFSLQLIGMAISYGAVSLHMLGAALRVDRIVWLSAAGTGNGTMRCGT